MKTKNEDEIRSLISTMLRVLNKFSRVERQPITLKNGEILSTKEIHTIKVIGDNKTMNVTEVGETFGVTKGAASQMISRLVKKGFVSKIISSHSNKEFELSLTKKGQQAFGVHESLHGKEFEELLKCLNCMSVDQLSTSEEIFGALEMVINMRLK